MIKEKKSVMRKKTKVSTYKKGLTVEEKQEFLKRANVFRSDAAFVVPMHSSYVSNPYNMVNPML